jgi:hypothetical protein
VNPEARRTILPLLHAHIRGLSARDRSSSLERSIRWAVLTEPADAFLLIALGMPLRIGDGRIYLLKLR